MITSGIFNSVGGDRKYDAKWFARYFATFIGNGVFPNPSTGLQVLENFNMTTIVKPGDGWINGYFIVNDGDYVLQHDIADGLLKRIDRVTMRLDFLSRKIEIVIKKGASASTPVAPVIQRDGDAYELVLANVLINNGATQITQANITDTRLNNSLCGIVHGTVDQVDTTTLFNQYQSWIEQQKLAYENDLASWTYNQKVDFETWQAQRELDFDTWQTNEKTGFDLWFATIQDILDENTAAKLQLQINQLVLDIGAVDTKIDNLAGVGNTKTVKQVSDSLTTHMAESAKHNSFATSSSLANIQAKFASLNGFSLAIGVEIAVKFTNANSATSPTLNISSTGAIFIRVNGQGAGNGAWGAGEVVKFVYDGTYYNIVGKVAIVDSISSSSTTQAATANAVKTAYDLANGKQDPIPLENRRKTTFGTANPTGGADGDIYFQYE